MNLSASGKALLALLVVIGVAAYIVVVDMGVSAGRIHAGVRLGTFDLGGLTEGEAADLLEEQGGEMETSPIVFSIEGFDCRFVPEELGWGPQPFDTAAAAMAVGRDGGAGPVLADRARAWVSGIEIEWSGAPKPRAVNAWLDDCEELASAMGVTLDRARLRHDLKEAIETWPRPQVWPLPVGR
ncbi:MAG TPA: hypothetical protein VNC78_02530 [Actinomycetota bacterium]|nr:hypothetical protein [Actinomycetota bacterium]